MTVETDAKFLGSGTGAKLLKTLEPIDDLSERFSTVMLINLCVLTGLIIISKIFSTISFTIVLPFGLALLLLFIWKKSFNSYYDNFYNLSIKIIIFCIFLRFIVPVTGLTVLTVDQLFLLNQQNQAAANVPGLEYKNNKNDEKITNEEASDDGWFSFGIKDSIDSMKEKISQITNSASKFFESVVTLIVIFIIKAIIIPLIILYFSTRLFRWLLNKKDLGYSLNLAIKDRFERPLSKNAESDTVES
jgi:hypothetical protein